MGKESKLFDKRFVHFMWDDELEGKEVFVADSMEDLIFAVDNDGKCAVKTNALRYNGNNVKPFHAYMLGANSYTFAYYDPNYEMKKAFNEGKKVQYQLVSGIDWADIDSEEALECRITEGRTFRIKPEEEKWIAYLAREENGICYLTSCTENNWESVQKNYTAKRKLFIGSESDAQHWYKTREKFTEVIRAWEDGKTIQVYETLFNKWGDCAGTLEWYTDCEYRVKPECPCTDGIDSKACVGCEHSEDGKRKYKPYVTVEEFIQDYQERFPTAVPRPAHTMSLIWLTNKVSEDIHLVTGFYMTDENENEKGVCIRGIFWSFRELFSSWIFLDGSPCGKEC